jgi:uncharacterized protein
MTALRAGNVPTVAPLQPGSGSIEAQPNPDTRFHHLDVLRGFALFGMLMVHLTYYAKGSGRLHEFILASVQYVFETKFYALFAFLFGVSFAVQLTRARARGVPFVRLYARRLIGLALIAVVIKLVFDFNVLLIYATWGAVLLLTHNAPRRWILGLFALCALSLSALHLVSGALLLRREGSVARAESAIKRRTAERMAVFQEINKAKKGPYVQAVRGRARHAILMMTQRFWWRPSMDVLGLFLLGLLAVRSGVVQRPQDHRRLIARFMALGAGLFALALVIEKQNLMKAIDLGYSYWTWSASALLMIPDQFYLMFFYAGAVVLWGLSALAPLAWTGRMALTNYVVQLVFLEGVLGSHGLSTGIPTWTIPIVCVAFIAAQVAVSRWWLTRYRYGPMEWLWRSFTYGGIQPMRRDIAPAPRIAISVG